MQTVVELPEFIRRTHGLLSASETLLLINYLAEFPQAGDLMQGTGDVRKLRWARDGKGKAGVFESSTTFTASKYRSIC
jgi:hypothetical protein